MCITRWKIHILTVTSIKYYVKMYKMWFIEHYDIPYFTFQYIVLFACLLSLLSDLENFAKLKWLLQFPCRDSFSQWWRSLLVPSFCSLPAVSCSCSHCCMPPSHRPPSSSLITHSLQHNIFRHPQTPTIGVFFLRVRKIFDIFMFLNFENLFPLYYKAILLAL